MRFLSLAVPINRKIWVFSAGKGHRYSDNSRALFEYVSHHHPEITAIWLAKDDVLAAEIRRGGFRAVSRFSLKGLYFSLVSGVVIMSVGFSDVGIIALLFPWKKCIVQLWHGTPLKQLELYSIFSKFNQLLTFALVQYVGRWSDYIVSSTKENEEIYSQVFSLPKDRVLVLGQPRNDQLLSTVGNHSSHLQKRKIVYMPTWREFDLSRDLFFAHGFEVNKVNKWLISHNAELYIKLHSNTLNEVLEVMPDSPRIFQYVGDDIYKDLATFDLLITDYSSVYFDYLLLNKPIVFAAFDLPEYIDKRGFYYDYKEVTPGPIASNWGDVLIACEDLLTNPSNFEKERAVVCKRFNGWLDANSSQRVYAFIRSATSVKDNHEWPVFLLLAIALLTHWSWFDFGSIISYADYWYQYQDAAQLSFLPTTWMRGTGFGSPNIELYKSLFTFLQGVITRLGLGYTEAVRFTHLIPIALCGFLSPYYLCRKFTENKLVSFVTALIYGSTTSFIMRQQLGHLSIAFVEAIFPCIFLLLINALQSQTLKRWIVFILIFALGVVYEPRMMYIATCILLSYAIVFYRGHILRSKHLIFIVSLLFLASNSYWLLPVLTGAFNGGIVSTASRALFGNSQYSLLMSLAFFHHSWTGGYPLLFQPQVIMPYFWMPPIVLGIVLLTRSYSAKLTSQAIFFAILYLVGVMLTKQIDQPFPFLFQWLRDNIPGFILFRAASKFYILQSFGFSMSLFFGLLRTRDSSVSFIRKHLFYCLMGVLILACFLNLKPLFSGAIGGALNSTEIPAGYTELTSLLKRENIRPIRYLSLPVDSRWMYYTDKVSRVSLVDVTHSVWSEFVPDYFGYTKLANWERFISAMRYNYSADMLRLAGIKYVVVPMDVTESNDRFFDPYGGKQNPAIRELYISSLEKIPFLKKKPTNRSEDAVVFEVNSSAPYIFSKSALMQLRFNPDFLQTFYDFSRTSLGKDFLFIRDDKYNDKFIQIKQPLSSIDFRSIKNGAIEARFTGDAVGQLLFSQKSKKGILDVKITKGVLNIVSISTAGLKLGGTLPLKSNESDPVQILSVISPKSVDYIEYGGSLKRFKLNHAILQKSSATDRVMMYKFSSNLVNNPSFEDGSWLNQVADCNRFDSNPVLSMSIISNEKTEGVKSLQLEATRHTACVDTRISLSDAISEHVLSFDYQSLNGERAGFYLRFDDESKTVIRENIPASTSTWQSYAKKVTIPAGAKNARLYLYGYSLDEQTNVITRYDNVQFGKLELVKTIEIPQEEGYEKIPVTLKEGENTFEYVDPRYDYKNLLPNPSFETRPWQEKVGDCNRYDDTPQLAMRLNEQEKTDGAKSLELEATRHTACMATTVPIKPGATYLLSFDYQSPNAKQASYYIGFNDPEKTSLKDQLTVTSTAWNAFSNTFTAPKGATSLSLYVYARETDKKTAVINRYDNFKLIEVPDLRDAFYLVSEPERKLVEPKSVEFELINPTKKLVHIKGATTPFFLGMSESHHDQWQLQFQSEKIQGVLKRWWPFAKPDRIADEYHYKLNGFLNAWYIDTDDWCATQGKCTKNADGSYDIEMIIEFWPQRWFYLGLLISGTTLAGCLGYLGYEGVRSIRRRLAARKKEAV